MLFPSTKLFSTDYADVNAILSFPEVVAYDYDGSAHFCNTICDGISLDIDIQNKYTKYMETIQKEFERELINMGTMKRKVSVSSKAMRNHLPI